MEIGRIRFWLLTLLVPITVIAGGIQSDQKIGSPSLLSTAGNEETAVRFYYNPSPEDAFHSPLVFRVVKAGDPRLNTAPILLEGRTAFITGGEMQQLIEGLDRAGLSWRVSEKSEALGSFRHLLIGDVEIRVVSPKGMAVTNFNPKPLCRILQPLDHALVTPRALWEFQLFRVEDGCKVRGFNYQVYPDHW